MTAQAVVAQRSAISPCGTGLPTGQPDCWISIGEAAIKLDLSAGHLRRLCDERLESEGLARKVSGVWHLHAAYHQRLRRPFDVIQRDLAQMADLVAEGVRPRYIELAESRRDIVAGLTAFRFAHPSLAPRELRQHYLGHLAAERLVGPDARVKRLSLSTLYEWERLYADDGLRGLFPHYRREGDGDKPPTIGPEAWRAFIQFKHAGSRVKVREAYKLTRGLIALEHADQAGWEWPSYRTILLAYRERVSVAERTLRDEGPYKFAAKCLPKVARSLEETPAGSHLVGDERTLDLQARVPAANGTWRRARLKVTAWMDVRSRYFTGWHIAESANSDTILSAFKMACEAAGTLPDQVTIDNGRDYRTVAGRTRRLRKWDEYDSKRVSTAFERLDITAHYAIVRHPWSKSIESRFNTVAERFDKHFAGYWGGRPDQRPWDADAWTRANIELLPTEEEVRDAFAAFLAGLHEEPVAGDGSFGYCPRQLLQQFFTDRPRAVESSVLALCCSRMHGPIKVGRDGVRFSNIIYGKLDEEVWRLQGREVYLLADPVNADRVTLCDADGVPICVAFADRNLGLTRDEVRAASAMHRRATRTVKKYPEARDTLMRTTHQRIAELRSAAAKAERGPEPTPPERQPASVRLTRSDIAAGAERVRRAAGAEAMRRLSCLDEAADGVNRPSRISLADLPGSRVEEEGDEPVRRLSISDLPGLPKEDDHDP